MSRSRYRPPAYALAATARSHCSAAKASGKPTWWVMGTASSRSSSMVSSSLCRTALTWTLEQIDWPWRSAPRSRQSPVPHEAGTGPDPAEWVIDGQGKNSPGMWAMSQACSLTHLSGRCGSLVHHVILCWLGVRVRCPRPAALVAAPAGPALESADTTSPRANARLRCSHPGRGCAPTTAAAGRPAPSAQVVLRNMIGSRAAGE